MPNHSPLTSVSKNVFWDRFNLYGLQSFLILYLITAFGFSDKNSYALYGTYASLTFAFAMLGGVMADRLLGCYYASLLGGILIIFANLILCFHSPLLFYMGLSLMIVGIGFLKPNNTNLVGMIYKEDCYERTRAYSIFYVGIALGSIAGPIMYGFAYSTRYYYLGFILSALGTASSLLYLKKNKKAFLSSQDVFSLNKSLLMTVLSVLGCFLLIRDENAFNIFMMLAIISGVYFAIRFIKKMPLVDRLAVLSLIPAIMGSIFFVIGFLQIYSSILLFIHRHVDRQVIGHWAIPASWFGSLEPMCVFLMLPLFNKFWKILSERGKDLSAQSKIFIGLILSACAFLVFTFIALVSAMNHYLVFFLIVIANMIMAASELCIFPIAMSFINRLSPAGYKGTLMGVYFFSLTFSGYLSNVIMKLVPSSEYLSSKGSANLFLIMTAILLASAVLIVGLNKYFKKFEEKKLVQEILSS